VIFGLIVAVFVVRILQIDFFGFYWLNLVVRATNNLRKAKIGHGSDANTP
jgi:hypothetical protein